MGIMRFKNPAKVVSLIKKYKKNILVKCLSTSIYRSVEIQYALAEIVPGKENLQIYACSEISWCRGWIHEKLVGSINKHPYYSEAKNFSDHNVTVLLVHALYKSVLDISLQFMNKYEKEARWAQTKIISLQDIVSNFNMENYYLIIGSKNWKSNLPLLSMYMLVARAFNFVSGGTNIHANTLDFWLDALAKYQKRYRGEGDVKSFLDTINKGYLSTLMKYYKYITPKELYRGIRPNQVYEVHSIGIGDFSSMLQDFQEEGFEKIMNKDSYFSLFSREYHGEMAKKL